MVRIIKTLHSHCLKRLRNQILRQNSNRLPHHPNPRLLMENKYRGEAVGNWPGIASILPCTIAMVIWEV